MVTLLFEKIKLISPLESLFFIADKHLQLFIIKEKSSWEWFVTKSESFNSSFKFIYDVNSKWTKSAITQYIFTYARNDIAVCIIKLIMLNLRAYVTFICTFTRGIEPQVDHCYFLSIMLTLYCITTRFIILLARSS